MRIKILSILIFLLICKFFYWVESDLALVSITFLRDEKVKMTVDSAFIVSRRNHHSIAYAEYDGKTYKIDPSTSWMKKGTEVYVRLVPFRQRAIYGPSPYFVFETVVCLIGFAFIWIVLGYFGLYKVLKTPRVRWQDTIWKTILDGLLPDLSCLRNIRKGNPDGKSVDP